MNKFVVIAVTLALFTSACTKERKATFPHGEGENLLSVADYDGKTFVITTGKAIDSQKQNFSKAKDMTVKAKALGGESFSVVNYEVDTALAKNLLGTTPIVGRANFKYAGLIRVTDHYVKVYKVGKEEDIPVPERTYGEKLSDGRLAIPLIGYPVTGLFTIERGRNDLNEQTSNLKEKKQTQLGSATSFRMDLTKGQIFEAVSKSDIFPASYFNGEWFYSEMITSVQEEDATNIGFGEAYDTSLTPSSRVKFLSAEDTLKVVNLNVDERLVKEEDTNFKTTMSIPIDWKAFKISENGEGLAEKEDSTIHWTKRPFVQMKLQEATTISSLGSARLVGLEVTDDYFSFTLQIKQDNMRVKYAFMRVPDKNNYQAKRSFKEDRKLFGFFETKKSVAETYEISRREDIEKNLFVSRFNPKAGKIVYHFSKATPEWVRPTVREAFKAWDVAFKAAGTGMDIILDESQDVELGDIRYNVVNIVETLTGSNLFGFGPSIADPRSGEIISATTNVHITSIREQVVAEIRTYIALQLGLLKGSEIAGISAQMAMLNDMTVEEKDGMISVISDILPFAKKTKIYLPQAGKKAGQKFIWKDVDFRKRNSKKVREFDVAMAGGNIHKEIAEQCPELLSYIETLKKEKVTHNNSELAVLETCSKKVTLMKFAGTLVHEMGHNFGLRHNFHASNDVANFWDLKTTKTKTQVRSSSVMEYSSFNEDRLVIPGPYDIAAIRFGYRDAVQAKDGSVVSLNVQKNILTNLQAKRIEQRSFKFCTDEDVEYSSDPLCQRHDAGVTPLEVTKNIIADYHKSYQLWNYRRDKIRTRDPRVMIILREFLYFKPLQRFYEEWRLGIAKYLGMDEQYLERLSAKDFETAIQNMAKDPMYANFVKEYEPTSKLIFNFFYTLAKLEDRYCVYTNKRQEVDIIELSKLRARVYSTDEVTVNSCVDAIARVKDGSMKFVTELGYYLDDVKFDLSPQAVSEPLDIVGVAGDRVLALMAMTGRESLSYEGGRRGFAPSMLDEPQFREVVKAYAIYRVQNGISGQSIESLIPKDADVPAEIRESLKKATFPRFTEEKVINELLMPSLAKGTLVPGKVAASMNRLDSLSAFIVNSLEQVDKEGAAAIIRLPGRGYYVVDKADKTDALELVKAYNKVSALTQSKVFDDKTPEAQALVAALKANLPSMNELGSFTFAKAFEMLKKITSEMKPFIEDPNKVNDVVFLVRDLLLIMDTGAQMEVQKAQAQPGDVEKFLNTPVEQVFKAQGMTYSLVKETVDKRISAYNKMATSYAENRAEYDAQMDLITDALLMSAELSK